MENRVDAEVIRSAIHVGFSDYCLPLYCYFHNVSADMSSCLLQQDTWRNSYRRWFLKFLRRQSSGGCRFNPHYRRVTIQEYVTLVPVMANRIRTDDPRGFNKVHSSKFREGSRVRKTPEEGRRTYRPKRCGNHNIYEDNSPKTFNDETV